MKKLAEYGLGRLDFEAWIGDKTPHSSRRERIMRDLEVTDQHIAEKAEAWLRAAFHAGLFYGDDLNREVAAELAAGEDL